MEGQTVKAKVVGQVGMVKGWAERFWRCSCQKKTEKIKEEVFGCDEGEHAGSSS